MDRSGSFAEVIVFLDHFKSLADPRQRGKVVYPKFGGWLVMWPSVWGGLRVLRV